MSIASLLAVVDGGDASSAVMSAAVQLGRRFDAYVEALHVKLDPESSIPLVGEGMSGAMVEQISADLRKSGEEHAKAARAAYEAACRGGRRQADRGRRQGRGRQVRLRLARGDRP